MSELVRGGRAILSGIQAIAANALQLANNLDDLGRTPQVAANPADATGYAQHVPDAGRSRAKFTPLLAIPPRGLPPVARRSAGLPRINRPDAVTAFTRLGCWRLGRATKIPLSSRR